MLPGDFNKACSEIFGGMYQGMWSETQEWSQGMDLDYEVGISPHQARKVFKYAFAVNADDDTHETYRKQLEERTTKITSVKENTGFEVTEVLLPTQETLDFYAQPEAAGLKPVGKMRAKTWIIPTAAEEDLTEEEEEEAEFAAKTPEMKHYEFWVESDVLSHCVVGIKLEATVTELSFGVSYFDALSGVHCSFYQLLPNEFMAGWRAPEKEWLPMRKKGGAADAGFDDIPGEVGEENKVLDDGSAFEEQLPENNENGMNDRENESRGKNGSKGHAPKNFGNHSSNGTSTAVQMSNDAVEVCETGENLIQVPGNADEIVEKTFDVELR